MCNWRAWLLPGLLTLLILTALAVLVRGGPIEADLTARSGDIFTEDGTPWASATLDGRDSTIAGVAPSEAAFDAAISAANRVAGVYRVDSSGLSLLPLADPYTLGFTKVDNAITVTGSFPDGVTRAAVLDGVRSAMGGATLIDETMLARGAPVGFDGLASFAAASLPALASGQVSLDGTSLSVEGDATTIQAYDGELARLDAPIAGLQLANVAINAPIVSPYIWMANAGGAGVTLTGYVPSEADRASLVASAQALGSVTDEMVLGAGAPEGFAAAASALLDQMGGLDNAAASISDRELSLSGDAATSDAYNAANAFLGAIPGDFDSLSGQISPPIADPFVTMLSKTGDGYALSGVLPDETARAVILDALEATGVTIADNSTVARGAPAGVDVGELFIAASSQLAGLTMGTATLTNSDLDVTGTAPSFEGAAAAEAAIGDLATASLAVSADIEPGPVSPFTFAINAAEDGITLDGFVPSEEKRQQILVDVALQFPTVPVTNNLMVADGAPDGFDAMVKAGLLSIGRLQNGALSIADGDVSVTGQALHFRSIERIEAGVEDAAPTGFNLTTDIALLPRPSIVDAQGCQLAFARLLADNTIRFDTGRAAIDTVSLGLLDRLVRTLQSCPAVTVEIGGHTDSQGADESNQALSETRAEAVLGYVLDAGISPARVVAIGYGETDPIADNETDEGRALNRRIEFTVQR
ncbi:MAG: OmpA family protein [Devosiaceae bacterium]